MMGQVFQQVAALKEAIEKNPKDIDALVRLANMYHDAGKFDQAIEYYKKALDVEPKDPNIRTDMGICLRELGRADEAIAQFRTSLQYQPQHWQSWLNLAVVTLFDTNDLKTATEALAKVEQLNPGFKDLPLLKEELRKRKSS
jgi:tetratricopeptide (TPR) repeat protein